MGGGGVASDYDPIHTLQPSPEEIRAAVQAASDWGTYVMAHAYTSEAIRRLVENGVKVIEHGLLIDDETAQFVAEQGVVISTQVLIFTPGEVPPMKSEENRRKMRQVQAGQDQLEPADGAVESVDKHSVGADQDGHQDGRRHHQSSRRGTVDGEQANQRALEKAMRDDCRQGRRGERT